MSGVSGFLAILLTSLVPILATAMGGMFAERARASNIALDGCMLVAALAALAVGTAVGNPWVGVVAGMVAGALWAGVLSAAVYGLGCDLIIAGIAANLLAVGASLLVVQGVLGSTGTYAPTGTTLIPRPSLGFLADIPVIGPALQNQSALVWVTVLVTVAASIVLQRTRFGLHVKAVGESDEAALAVGVKPVQIRVAALLISGALAGIGGAYLSISSVASFNSQLTGGLGFIAFAAVVFGRATPWGTIGASLLFAAATSVAVRLQGTDLGLQQIVHALPYVATVVALAVQAVRESRRRRYDVSITQYVPAIIPKG
ncbi:ABC transporter permease [Nakamurella flavida]|uniref:ABC transporter permease n=1 Tax=Nakamurella flavida TaxID=363630 RepID=A0A939C3T0_9ACTN|nr:ABC transporter permease [Nakamurella flavida]MBM9477361.1 ABC transporter permease [Nakamurella flavida]MDP9777293.1 simple sugar transport system permease protein [Nakamurella flavida]